MLLAERLVEYVRACFTGLWIQSHEHSDALLEISQVCQRQDWQILTWSIDEGLYLQGHATDEPGSDPLAAIRSLSAFSSTAGTTLLVLQNFHRFLQSAEIVQALSRRIVEGRQHRTFVVVLSPIVQIPVELEKLFVVLEHALPDRAQLTEIAQGIATEEGELPAGDELERLLDAAVGLTRLEAENAFSLSLVRHNSLRPDAVWELKCQTLAKSGLLHLHRGGESFESLGGLANLKAFCRRALLQPQRHNPLKRPRGGLLLSPPGCGKSQFAKCLGRETSRPVLMLDVGALLGSLVGQSEERTRHALQIADAMAPCVLMVDEVEKAFAGAGGSGQSDGGVSARMFAGFLTWLNDHESDVFVVCTANGVGQLPPEFARAGRFDSTFFIDLPQREEKNRIWDIHRTLFAIDASQEPPPDEGYTGAEIRACCRLAALLNVPLREAALHIAPVASTAAESVERLRQWASGRCISADAPGLYRYEPGSSKSRRRVNRDPSQN